MVLGRRVYQDDQAFTTGTPSTLDEKFIHPAILERIKSGESNLDLMRTGNAPIGIDGRPVNLHHVLGDEPGPMAELLGSTHSRHHGPLHGLVTDGNSFRNDATLDRQYNKFRRDYWKERAKGFDAC